MKISKGQVFNLYDDFANVNQTFLANKEFDISDLLANGVYQYDFAHKFYTHDDYVTYHALKDVASASTISVN